ncbi:MAG: glycosyltransferase family 2 protein [Acidimicrobiales bacterium]
MIPVSVVVPAHDEEQVIGRCLSRILDGAEPGEVELIVVCNGCRDRTAEVARHAAPEATVCVLPEASKPAALNQGDSMASRFPIIYVDADVVVGIEAVRAMARVLASGEVACVSPTAYYDVTGRPWPVRKYISVWQRLPYFQDERVGAVCGLSQEGRARFGDFPPVIADDQFVLQHFTREERRCLADHRFVVETPWTCRDLLRVRTRVYRGNRQLARLPTPVPPTAGARAALLHLAHRPGELPGLAVYSVVTLLAKGMASSGRRTRWERDESTRRPAPASMG